MSAHRIPGHYEVRRKTTITNQNGMFVATAASEQMAQFLAGATRMEEELDALRRFVESLSKQGIAIPEEVKKSISR